MSASWDVAASLGDVPQVAGLLGDRHRIIANDWQAAEMSALAGRILHRAVELSKDRVHTIRRAPRPRVRRVAPRLLHSVFELIAHAADLLSDSAGLVHDNEPRWRRFRARVDEVVHDLDSSDDSADSHDGGRQSARTTVTAPPTTDHTAAKPLLGLRGQPGRLALAVFRLPLGLYRRGGGWLLGQTFLVFAARRAHDGRRYETAAMVLTYERATGEAAICSAWGPNTDWIRNLRIAPAVEVRLGRQSFVPEQRFLTDDEAMAVASEFRRRHPHRLRLLSRVLGWGDLRSDAEIRDFVHTHPFVSFRPRAVETTTSALNRRATPERPHGGR